MTRLYAILAAIGGVLASILGAFALGGRSAKNARDAKDARREVEAYRKAQEARDEMADKSDADVFDWLQRRSKK